SSGTSFSGGTGFSGNPSFTGSTSFTGGTGGTGFQGGTGTGFGAGGRFGALGASGYQVATSNPFASYYANPFAGGIVSGTNIGIARTPSFGNALYTTTTTGSNMLGGVSGGTANISNSNQGVYQGSNSIGVRRAPAYSTSLAFEYKPMVTTRVQRDVQ